MLKLNDFNEMGANGMILYLAIHVLGISLAVILGWSLSRRTPSTHFHSLYQKLVLSLFIVFNLRYFSYVDLAVGVHANQPAPFGYLGNLIGFLGIWFELTLIIIFLIHAFIRLPIVNQLIHRFFFPGFIFYLFISYLSAHLQLVGLAIAPLPFGIPLILITIEHSLVALVMMLHVKVHPLTFTLNTKPSILKTLGVLFGVLITSMPNYGLQLMIGDVSNRFIVLDISFTHRLFIYTVIGVGVVIFYAFRKQTYQVKRFALMYIAVATTITFSRYFSFGNVLTPWTWPLHLCNATMYLLVISLATNNKKIFYFTYFISVFGALLAILMPDYPASTNPTSYFVIRFWYNHAIAFILPILYVSLGMFPRPQLKEMKYSLVGFVAYFFLVLIVNVWFSNYTSVDFFFINSEFIVSKLGLWAERLYRISVSFSLGELSFVFRPIYQTGFFLVYVGISFAMWFIYSLGYQVADGYVDLSKRQYQLHIKQMELIKQMNGKKLSEPLEKDAGIKLELRGFSKKYARQKQYAVKEASLIINGGEIFGFLGPNGAGKSSTIKAIVGIHGISEGSIMVCGYDVDKQPIQSKRLIGYVPDHYALYENLSAREYIHYIADLYGVSQVDRELRIKKYIDLFYLQGLIDQPMRTYSHGTKQKITIIASLIHNPKLWVLDEPLTGLDPDSIYQVKQAMNHHARQGNIVLFSSHLIDLVENLCTRIVVINKGTLFSPIKVEEILKKETLEAYYLRMTVKTQTGKKQKKILSLK